MDEPPDLHIVDLDPALAQFGDEAAQREVALRTLDQPVAQLACQQPGLYPPILDGATLPVSRCRRTHLIALLSETSNRAAAPRADIPSVNTAATTRSRRSIDKGFAIPAGLLPSQQGESYLNPLGNPPASQTNVIPL